MGAWSLLEYVAISRESAAVGSIFYLTSVPVPLVANLPEALRPYVDRPLKVTSEEVTQVSGGGRVCLLDPRAEKELAPGDAGEFDWFVFGGILGTVDFFLLLFFFCGCCFGVPVDGGCGPCNWRLR